jgi:hypothetical protein
MLSNRLAFAALAVACIGAAAGGGYLATRQNVVPAPTSAQESMPQAARVPTSLPAEAEALSVPPSIAPSTPAVQETEALVGDRVGTSSAPVAKTPTRRTDTPARAGAAPRDTRAAAPSPPAAGSGGPAGSVARPEPPPTLTNTWPSGAASQPPVTPAPAIPAPVDTSSPVPPEDRAAQDPPRAPEPPQKIFEELVVSAEQVIGLQTENRITSETARIEDRVEARVTRDVKVGDRVAIPAGSRALGSVMQVERGGKFKERARLGIRFHTLVLVDGTRVPISTETIYRDGDAPGNRSAAKVGGAAVGGAILGAILGGAKGAVIGGTAGAGAGSAAVMAGDRNAATFPAGTPMTVRLVSPVTITSEK